MAAASQVAAFLSKYDPAVAKQARAALAGVRAQLPGATEIVYDNYNALVIGFGASERQSDAFLSIAVYPRWVNLFFFPGTGLPDPMKLLQGSGSTVRRIPLRDGITVEHPAVRELIAIAHRRADAHIDPRGRRRIVIKTVSAKQRPRKPSAAARPR